MLVANQISFIMWQLLLVNVTPLRMRLAHGGESPNVFYCDKFLSFCEKKIGLNNTYKRILIFKNGLNSSIFNFIFKNHQVFLL